MISNDPVADAMEYESRHQHDRSMEVYQCFCGALVHPEEHHEGPPCVKCGGDLCESTSTMVEDGSGDWICIECAFELEGLNEKY